MSTDGSSAAAERPRRRAEHRPAPAEMTEGEKRAAEWEARHDVAARGSRVPPHALQHYLAHERLVEGPARGRTTAGPRAAAGPSEETRRTVPAPVEETGGMAPPRRRPWSILRRLRRRG